MLAQQMLDDYNALESTLNEEQKALLQKYSDSLEKFIFSVCDTVYEDGSVIDWGKNIAK